MQQVAEALEEQGAPIQDLIDAQSFIWLRASAEQAGDAGEGPAGAKGRFTVLQQQRRPSDASCS